MIVRLILLLLAVEACHSSEDELRAFTSDGCSAFPDGTPAQRQLWRACCVRHDFSYWIGGNAEQRKQADEHLQVCVAGVGEPAISQMMLAGVRVGGSPWLPTEFRWGYGWSNLRGYKTLTREEQAQVSAKLDHARAMLRAAGVEVDDDYDAVPSDTDLNTTDARD